MKRKTNEDPPEMLYGLDRKMIDFEAIFRTESDRIESEIVACLKQGFEIWHWWDEPIQPTDETKTFGFLTLIKRK